MLFFRAVDFLEEEGLRAVLFFRDVFFFEPEDDDLREVFFFEPEDDDLREVLFFDPDERDVVFFRDEGLLLVLPDEPLVSPDCERCLLTVRAAISFARFVDLPRFLAPSLTCSYCRSRLLPDLCGTVRLLR
ncbi:MAG: hypothetical protein ABR613_02730 [Actinomycetota bacterium]